MSTKTTKTAGKILNSGNAKTRKGETRGWKTYGIHFAPASLSGFNVCRDASPGCAAACLNTAGRGQFNSTQLARIAKTRRFFADKTGFLSDLKKEIALAIRKAEKEGFHPCFRLNLTSDLPWEKIRLDGKTLFQHFPGVRFYDYTASPDRMAGFLAGEMPKNYHLTFSRKENTPDAVVQGFLASGGNVAVVFRGGLPRTAFGVPVIDGDADDLRFLDKKGRIVGLVEKGKAKHDTSGFVLPGV